MIKHKVKGKTTHVASPSTLSNYSLGLEYPCEFLNVDIHNEEKLALGNTYHVMKIIQFLSS